MVDFTAFTGYHIRDVLQGMRAFKRRLVPSLSASKRRRVQDSGNTKEERHSHSPTEQQRHIVSPEKKQEAPGFKVGSADVTAEKEGKSTRVNGSGHDADNAYEYTGRGPVRYRCGHYIFFFERQCIHGIIPTSCAIFHWGT